MVISPAGNRQRKVNMLVLLLPLPVKICPSLENVAVSPNKNRAMKTSTELEREAALQVAALMVAAARTAPKTRGIDNIHALAIDDQPTMESLVNAMRSIGRKENRPGMVRDAGNIQNAPAVVVIGVQANTAGLNCGFCGKPTCKELQDSGGICAFNSIDLGIAACSAAAVASNHRIDNRLMYSIGRAAMHLGLLPDKVKQALGIPLSVTGKNPFFDRKS